MISLPIYRQASYTVDTVYQEKHMQLCHVQRCISFPTFVKTKSLPTSDSANVQIFQIGQEAAHKRTYTKG